MRQCARDGSEGIGKRWSADGPGIACKTAVASVTSARLPVIAGSSVLLALLACQLDLSGVGFDLDFGDAGLFGEGECRADDDCEAGHCCVHGLLAPSACRERVAVDPTRPCSILADDRFAVCVCESFDAGSRCPGWLTLSPDQPNCGSHPYLRCSVSCADSLCICETEETSVLGDAGLPVPSCPPPEGSNVCVDAAR